MNPTNIDIEKILAQDKQKSPIRLSDDPIAVCLVASSAAIFLALGINAYKNLPTPAIHSISYEDRNNDGVEDRVIRFEDGTQKVDLGIKVDESPLGNTRTVYLPQEMVSSKYFRRLNGGQ